MAEESKNIDRLFKEKLVGHKVTAPAGAWERLEADLVPAKKRVAAFYWRLAAAVVLLLLAFGAGYFFSQYNVNEPELAASRPAVKTTGQTTEKAVVPADDHFAPDVVSGNTAKNGRGDKTVKTERSEKPVTEKNILLAEETATEKISSPANTNKKDENAAAQRSAVAVEATKPVLKVEPVPEEKSREEESLANAADIQEPESENVVKADETMAQDQVSKGEERKDMENMTPEMLHRLLVQDDGFDDEAIAGAQEPSVRGWSVGGQVIPTYSYRSLGGGSFQTPDEEVDLSYFNEIESGLSTVGGGISLAYNFNERLSIGSGLFLSRIGQENDDVIAYDSPGSGYMYKLGTSSGTVSINPAKFEKVMIRQLDDSKDSVPGDYLVNGTFVQNLDYLDVPLVLNYKVLNKRFSVNVSGGLSPGLLVNNRSYFDVDDQKIQTGVTENIKPMIFNSVIGIGLAYDVSKKVSINLSPTFKYSLSPVNTGSALKYHPYSISLFTGIAYKL